MVRGGCMGPGRPGGDPPTATAAGGTHPTGMHSCFSQVFPSPIDSPVGLKTGIFKCYMFHLLIDFIRNSLHYKNANIVNFVLAVLLQTN